jgi:hypothetical protein
MALPDNATVHLVSHSRGGLIGELLCRGRRTDGRDPFEAREIELLTRAAKRKQLCAEELRASEELNIFSSVSASRWSLVRPLSLGDDVIPGTFRPWLSVVLNSRSDPRHQANLHRP